VLNFGGLSHELWCDGGEAAFVQRLIRESARFSDTCLWFSSLVSKRETLPLIQRTLRTVKAVNVHTFDMAQGQKKSRVVAWTFLKADAHRAWAAKRWR
jgi:23S rRNA (adenine1618-N6)-methyltransferase